MLGSLLRRREVWRRLAVERLTEPLHMHLISAGVAIFGGFRAKVAFDLVPRHQHAFGLLKAADEARARGIRELTVVELGVAAGAGLMNLCELAGRVSAETGVGFRLFGFDSGEGMPSPNDYRDHPELYKEGWFPMDRGALEAALPANAQLRLGPLAETVGPFAAELDPAAPLGFATLDVDFYSSASDALRLFEGAPEAYLPHVNLYVDDLALATHTPHAGELLAIAEFNQTQALRKLDRDRDLRHTRVFKHSEWLAHMFKLQVLDHPERNDLSHPATIMRLENPYLRNGQ